MEVICTLDVLQVRLALCVIRVRPLARLRHSKKLLAEQILNDVWSGTPIFGMCHPCLDSDSSTDPKATMVLMQWSRR